MKLSIPLLYNFSAADNSITAVRYLLAFAVLVAHFNYLSDTNVAFPITSYNGVCGFFTISGFLIFRSYHNAGCNFKQYIYRRGVRILPSYIIVVVFFTLVLSFVSSLSYCDYFSSSQTWRYLTANLLFANFIEPSLPGVFTDGVTTAVNGSLWTMKVEWALYLSVPVVAWLIFKRGYKPWVVIGFTYLFSVAYRWGFWALYCYTGSSIYETISRQFFGQMTFFYLGALLFCYYERIYPKLLVKGIIAFAVYIFVDAVGLQNDYYQFVVSPLILSSIVLSAGLVSRWGKFATSFTDCSYEIYLFHFPIIQFFVNTLLIENKLLLFILSTFTTIFMAYVTALLTKRFYLRKNKKPKQYCSR